MKYLIQTRITLDYRAKGFVLFMPDEAETFVNLDETAPQVKAGLIVLSDMSLEHYEIHNDAGLTAASLTYSAEVEFTGTREQLDGALKNGWLEWPETIEDLEGQESPLTLVNASYDNTVCPVVAPSPNNNPTLN